jgi:hypothetical protein
MTMTAFMIVALTPLGMGIAALVIGLPVGLHYAKKDRAARLRREKREQEQKNSADMTAAAL